MVVPEHITHLADIGNNLSNLVADGHLYSMVEKIVPFENWIWHLLN